MLRISRFAGGLTAMLLASVLLPTAPRAAEPIKIGFSMALTGGLAPNGKSALLAMQIWEKDINAKGGLLGRPVKLIYYDDQSQPSTVPGIYTKLLDVDKVDLVVGPYATAQIAPAMPIVIQHNMAFITLLGLAVNEAVPLHALFPDRAERRQCRAGLHRGLLRYRGRAESQAQDGRDRLCRPGIFPQRRRRRAARMPRTRASRSSTTRAIRRRPPISADRARHPGGQSGRADDRLVSARFRRHGPRHPRGRFHAEDGRRRHGRPAIDRDQDAARAASQRHRQLRFLAARRKPRNSPAWPVFSSATRREAVKEGVDPLGYYMVPWAYAYLQVLGDAVEATKGLDQGKIANYMHETTFKTVGRRHQVRRGRRMGQVARAAGAVPAHHRQRPQAVPRPQELGDPRADIAQGRQRDLSLRRGAEIAAGSYRQRRSSFAAPLPSVSLARCRQFRVSGNARSGR